MSGSETNPISPILPVQSFDGQVFIDFYGIQWTYSADDNYWVSNEKVEKIPVADGMTTGLLPKAHKAFLDQIPPKGGGYAIILRPAQIPKTHDNPDALLFGTIILESQSLNIVCVDSNGNPTNCNTALLLENINQPPGFDFSFSELFKNNFCVVIPGGPGPTGPQGQIGDAGADGTGDGPQGDTGPAGKDATTPGVLSGIQVIESSDVYDTAIVDLSLDNGQLVCKYGQIAVPTSAAVQQVIAAPLIRQISFLPSDSAGANNPFAYTLTAIPSKNPNELQTTDPVVAFYPQHFTPTNLTSAPTMTYQPAQGHLSDVVNLIIQPYQTALDNAAAQYDQQITEYIISTDTTCRGNLDALLNELFNLQSAETPDFCIGINCQCSAGGSGSSGSSGS